MSSDQKNITYLNSETLLRHSHGKKSYQQCYIYHVRTVGFGKLIFTSYRWFVVYAVVGHRAVGLLQVFVISPCRGGAVKIYN